MDQYLFLFPVEEYFNSVILVTKFCERGYKIDELFDMIDARYRKNDYEINWLLFGRKDDESKPDLAAVPNYVRMFKDDKILDAGVSFEKHTSKCVYADPDYVLKQMPPHKKLVLGGFHTYDCVSKMAKKSHESGVDTFVDEDTTDFFFVRKHIQKIPVVRKNWTLEGLGNREFMLDHIKKYRKDKPWFVQN